MCAYTNTHTHTNTHTQTHTHTHTQIKTHTKGLFEQVVQGAMTTHLAHPQVLQQVLLFLPLYPCESPQTFQTDSSCCF